MRVLTSLKTFMRRKVMTFQFDETQLFSIFFNSQEYSKGKNCDYTKHVA